MNTPRILYCTHCKVWFTVAPTDDGKCVDCKQATHLTTAEAMEPKPLKFSYNDRRFLRSLRISVNNDHEDDCA